MKLAILPLILLLAIPALAQTPQAEHVFPLFVDVPGMYRSELTVSNPYTTGASCGFVLNQGSFRKSENFTVASRGVHTILSAGTGESIFSLGVLSCSGPVGAMLTISNVSGLTTIAETTVPSTVETAKVHFVADHRHGRLFGIALANNGDTNEIYQLAMNGRTSTAHVPAHSVLTAYVDILFDLPKDYIGTIEITGTKVYALGLRFNGAAFTVIPPTMIPSTTKGWVYH